MLARSPEELETLLEDAVLLGDATAVRSLFAAGAVLVSERGPAGPEQAMAALSRIGFVASPRSVGVWHDTAVVVGDSTVHVSVRSRDGTWRLVVALVQPDLGSAR